MFMLDTVYSRHVMLVAEFVLVFACFLLLHYPLIIIIFIQQVIHILYYKYFVLIFENAISARGSVF